MTQDKQAIVVSNLTKRYGERTVVSGVNLTIPRGSIYGFLGSNGSGKTTTLRMICGLVEPTAGTGTCLGINLMMDIKKLRSSIGYMTQNFSLYNELTVLENLNFIASIYNLDDKKSRINEVVKLTRLEPYLYVRAGSLSGGWEKKLSLAAAILHKPKILVLDEPTAGVDPLSRREFWDLIYNFSHDGVTVLVSTHYMDEAERCNKLVYLNMGNLIFEGSPKDLINEMALTTWCLEGENLEDKETHIKTLQGVEQVTRFGNSLHISGRKPEVLEQSLKKSIITNPSQLYEIPTSLEDAFIFLTSVKLGKGNKIND